MEKATQQKQARKTGEPAPLFNWVFGVRNMILLGIALAVIIIGYVFLGIGPYDSAQSTTIGPVLLVIGYLVLLPLGILSRDK